MILKLTFIDSPKDEDILLGLIRVFLGKTLNTNPEINHDNLGVLIFNLLSKRLQSPETVSSLLEILQLVPGI